MNGGLESILSTFFLSKYYLFNFIIESMQDYIVNIYY